MTSERDGWLDAQLAVKERAFNQGNLGALQDALSLCKRYEIPLPEWLSGALREVLQESLLARRLTPKSGRQSRWLTQYKEDMRDLVRADTFQECIDHGVPRVDAYHAASLLLHGNFGAGAPDTIAKAVKRYRSRSESEPFRYHLLTTLRLPEPTVTEDTWHEVHSLIRV